MSRSIFPLPSVPNTKKWSSFFLVVFLFSSLCAFPQSDKKNLQKKYDKLENEIKDAEDLLQETQQNKNASLGELKILNRKIDVRQQMINNLSDQVTMINTDISETMGIITSMESDIKELKDEYAKMICYAYVNQTDYQPLHLFFAAKNIGDAIRQVQYVKEYNAFRKEQIGAIKAISAELEEKVGAIQVSRNEKQDILSKEQTEQKKLTSEKQQKDKSVKTFQTKEKDLKKQIAQKKKDADDLQKKLQNIIAQEIKKEKEKAEAAAKKEAEKKSSEKNTSAKNTSSSEKTEKTATNTSVNVSLTPEMQLIAKNFEGNKGRLPWPVERGTITGKFGKQPHPVLKDVITENNGIDITTTQNASVRSIFEGEVVNVIFNPGFQKGVIIKHGNYYTVYTGLDDVSVKPGDKVTAKQKIGTAWYDADEGKTEVHLEIWKGTVLLDPSSWISKQ